MWQTHPYDITGTHGVFILSQTKSIVAAILSTIVFHALQDSLKLWINNKRSWVSNANFAPISTFEAPTNKFGIKTLNCISASIYNTSGSITWDWRDLPQPDAATPINPYITMKHIYHMKPTQLKCGQELHLNPNILEF